MPTLFLYLLQSSACMALFYILYMVFFRKETFYRYNRALLLSAFVFAVVCPLLPIPGFREVKEAPAVFVAFNDHVDAIKNTTASPGAAAPEHHWDITTILISVYLVIAGILLIIHLLQLWKVRRLLRAGKTHSSHGFTYVYLPGLKTPFSFLHFIFLDPEAYEPAELQHIILHEQAHVNQRHTFDNLLAALYCCFCWINPFAWMARKALQLNLEYLADEAALEQVSASKPYQYSLIKTASVCHPSSIRNHFSKSFIKNRIVMINTAKSSRKRAWKYLLILPVLAISAGLLSASNPSAAVIREAPGERYMETVHGYNFIVITPKTTDAEIFAMHNKLEAQGLGLRVYDAKRNEAGAYTAFSAEVRTKAGSTASAFSGEGKTGGSVFLIVSNQLASAGVNPSGDYPFPSRLLRIVAEEDPEPVRGLITDSTYKRRYPGGADGLAKFLSSNIRYPHQTTEAGIVGLVSAQFKIHPDGSVTDITVVNREEVNGLLADEVIRTLKKMPAFTSEQGSSVETASINFGFFLDNGDGNVLKPKNMSRKGPEIVVVGYGPQKPKGN